MLNEMYNKDERLYTVSAQTTFVQEQISEWPILHVDTSPASELVTYHDTVFPSPPTPPLGDHAGFG